MNKVLLKNTANLLTLTRVLISFFILVIAQFPNSKVMLGYLIFANIVGWTTDILDGRLARKSGQPEGRIGKMDLFFDTFMQWSSFYALSQWGYIPMLIFIPYTIFSALLVIIFKLKKEVISMVSFPGLIMPYIFSYIFSRPFFYIYTAWVVITLLLDWRRLVYLVNSFINSFANQKKKKPV